MADINESESTGAPTNVLTSGGSENQNDTSAAPESLKTRSTAYAKFSAQGHNDQPVVSKRLKLDEKDLAVTDEIKLDLHKKPCQSVATQTENALVYKCGLCSQIADSIHLARCGHMICGKCVESITSYTLCPSCNRRVWKTELYKMFF